MAAVASAARAQTLSPDFARYVSQEEAVVVSITTTSSRAGRGDDRSGAADDESEGYAPTQLRGQRRSFASGIVIGSDGRVLTSAHVVADADETVVRIADGRQLPAVVLGLDRRSDVALLKIDAAGLTAATIGDPERLQTGDWVAAIGAPFGLEHSITAGIVSAKARSIEGGAGLPLIQTDVAINRGSSGGPLFNLRGEVVGINSMIYTDTGGYIGVSLALPIDIAIRIASELQAQGRVIRGTLGASVQPVTPDLARAFGLSKATGALVVRTQRGGAGERAGLRRGDIVLGVNGDADMDYASVQRAVADAKPEQALALHVWRDGRREQVRAIAAEVRADRAPAATVPSMPASFDKRLGLVMTEIAPEERAGLRTDARLWIREVHGAALRAGLQADDLLAAVNGTAVQGLAEFDAAIAAVPAGTPLALLVMRGDRWNYVAVTPVGHVGERIGQLSP